MVWVHVVKTSVRKLYRCQVIIVRHSLDAPLSQTRYWASSDLEAAPATLADAYRGALGDRDLLRGWQGRTGLGSLPSHECEGSPALLDLAMLAYVFLEEEQQRLRILWQRPVSIGEARREIQRRHRRCLLEWLHRQFLSGVHPESLFELFAA